MKFLRAWSSVFLGLTGFLIVGCSHSSPPPREVKIVGSGTTDGRGYPHGASGQGEYFLLSEAAPTRHYGYTQEEPVRVKTSLDSSGPGDSKRFLNALRGPQGQPIVYERRGSCCPFRTKNSDLGSGLLDVYEITYNGLAEPLVLYVNMYDPGEPLIPVGLTARGSSN